MKTVGMIAWTAIIMIIKETISVLWLVNILDYGVIGNTVDFDSAIVGSSPASPTCYCF